MDPKKERILADLDKRLAEKLKSGREYRRVSEMTVRAKDESQEMIVEGYACTFNEEYLLFDLGDYKVFEKIDRNAFADCDMSDVIMQYDHQGRVFARTSNGTLELATDDRGLHTRANLGGTEIGRNLYEEINGGYTTKMSFGFRVEEDKREVEENHETGVVEVHRTITKFAKLYDVSAVSLPANDATEISARCFSEGVIEELKQEVAEKRARDRLKLKIYLEVTNEA